MALARSFSPEPRRSIDLDSFAAGISGTVITPGDAAYDEARQVHNTMFDRYPALIVQAAGSADVARTVVFARDAGLELSVRGGAHSMAGFGTVDGGVVLDLGAMKGLHIDPDRRVAWAQAGLTAGEYTAAAAAHGLATPFGDVGSVGIGGLTLGGGIGWLVRKHGMTIDALLSVDIVTADGHLINASEDEHQDLFWAVRGGGGNFGVVTRFQFKLYPVDTVLGGALFMPLTRDTLRSLVPIAAAAPTELTTISFIMAAPPAPFIPAEVVGQPTLAIMFVYDGDPEAGQAALAPFRAVATPIADLAMPMPYVGIYELTKDASEPGKEIIRSVFLETLDDAAVDAILAAMEAPSSPMSMFQIRVLGGAMASVDSGATAFAHRQAPIMVAALAMFEDMATAPVHEAWADALLAQLRPNAIGVYSNFIGAEDASRVREAYPDLTYHRLAQVKRRYDPTNMFHRNQNIAPAGAS
jgi:FAD/FMN-containing dehydrogenase